MNALEPNRKILSSKAEIMVYCGNISDHVFRKYVRQGLPALYDGARWLAYADNIDEWFKSVTRVSMGAMIDKIPD